MNRKTQADLVVGICLFLAAIAPAKLPAQTDQPLRLVLPHRVLFDVSLPDYVAEEKGVYARAGIKASQKHSRTINPSRLFLSPPLQ